MSGTEKSKQAVITQKCAAAVLLMRTISRSISSSIINTAFRKRLPFMQVAARSSCSSVRGQGLNPGLCFGTRSCFHCPVCRPRSKLPGFKYKDNDNKYLRPRWSRERLRGGGGASGLWSSLRWAAALFFWPGSSQTDPVHPGGAWCFGAGCVYWSRFPVLPLEGSLSPDLQLL